MLVTCSDCYKQISNSANPCPFCGHEDAGSFCVENQRSWAKQAEQLRVLKAERHKEAIGKVVKINTPYRYSGDTYHKDIHRHRMCGSSWFSWKPKEYFYFRITEIKGEGYIDQFCHSLGADCFIIGEALCCGKKFSIETIYSDTNYSLFWYLFGGEESKFPLWEKI